MINESVEAEQSPEAPKSKAIPTFGLVLGILILLNSILSIVRELGDPGYNLLLPVVFLLTGILITRSSYSRLGIRANPEQGVVSRNSLGARFIFGIILSFASLLFQMLLLMSLVMFVKGWDLNYVYLILPLSFFLIGLFVAWNSYRRLRLQPGEAYVPISLKQKGAVALFCLLATAGAVVILKIGM